MHTSAAGQHALQVIAARLREIRQDANLSAHALAKACGWHGGTKISKIEHGKQTPTASDIRQWCAQCDASDQADDLVASLRVVEGMYVEWRRMQRAGLLPLQRSYDPLYERTQQFRVYEPGVIPGLLQTRDYALARMGRIAKFKGLPDDVEQAVDVRIRRQKVLSTGARLHAVLEEWALYSRIGSTDMMAAQLGRLIESAARPTIFLGIVPMVEERRMWSGSGFWIFDEAKVLIETYSAELSIVQQREIALYGRAFAQLAEMAVYGSRARQLITRAIDALDTPGGS